MKITLRLSFLTLIACANVMAADDGWLNLFNGKDLSGWVQRGGKASYVVQNGAIVGSTVPETPNSFLCTERDYGDFILELDFKVDPQLNSGIQFRSECFDMNKTIEVAGEKIKIAANRVHGYQMEIDMAPAKNRWWVGGIYDEARRSWLFPGKLGGEPKAFTDQGAKCARQGDWNHVRIEAKGNSIKTWLNGEARASITDDMTPRGFIALQVHTIGKDTTRENLKVQFRNIRLKPL